MIGLGIDIGTTSICVVLYDDETKKIVSKKSKDHFFLPNSDYLQDPEKIVDTVFALIKEYQEFNAKTIGISSQMHGILYIDQEGRAVSDFYTWKNRAGLAYEKELWQRTGYSVFSGYGGVTHYHLQKKGQIPQTAKGFLGIGDYLALRLTGAKEAVVEESMADSFGFYHSEKHCFDQEAINAAGMDFSYFPKTVIGKTVLGTYQGKEVYAAIGDNQASFLGAVKERDTSIGMNVGTGSQISIYSPAYISGLKTGIRPFLGLGYLYVGASLNGGKAYERLALFLQAVCVGFTGQTVDVYQKMYEIAKAKENTSLVAVPNLYGQRGGEEKASGFFGLNSENFYPADFIHSFVYGMGMELWEIYQQFPERIKKGKNKITASGNGIRKNKLLQRELEKIFGFPLVFSDYEEEAAVGAGSFVLERGLICG